MAGETETVNWVIDQFKISTCLCNMSCITRKLLAINSPMTWLWTSARSSFHLTLHPVVRNSMCQTHGIKLFILTYSAILPDTVLKGVLNNLIHFPESQKELTVSLRISGVLDKKEIKNKTPPNKNNRNLTQKNPAPQKSYIFLQQERLHFPPLFSEICSSSLTEILYSGFAFCFCNDFKQKKSLRLSVSFTLADCG